MNWEPLSIFKAADPCIQEKAALLANSLLTLTLVLGRFIIPVLQLGVQP